MIHKTKFLLDACIPLGLKELLSGDYVESVQILPHDTPDNIILEEANQRNLVVITRDVKFVLQTILKNHDIVYQNQHNERYYIHGLAELIEKNCSEKSVDKRTKYLLKNETVIIP